MGGKGFLPTKSKRSSFAAALLRMTAFSVAASIVLNEGMGEEDDSAS
jgi:hypothetical protein